VGGAEGGGGGRGLLLVLRGVAGMGGDRACSLLLCRGIIMCSRRIEVLIKCLLGAWREKGVMIYVCCILASSFLRA